ncbi:hypothetical protein [Nocardia sp. NPDC051750]|uniref:hypothetical protein n=1 Tax=Nocardia sp. NPDC051750 TaxID=3364325 RepID=UPI0037B7197C
MGHSLRIDEDRLQSLVHEYESLGELARRAQEELNSVVAHEGKFWGNDEPGRHFEETYLADSQRVLGALAKTVESLIEEGKLVTGIARDLDNADREGFGTIRDAAAWISESPSAPVSSSVDGSPAANGTSPAAADQIPPTSTTAGFAVPAQSASPVPGNTVQDDPNSAPHSSPHTGDAAAQSSSPDAPHTSTPEPNGSGAPAAGGGPTEGAIPAANAAQGAAGTAPPAARTPGSGAVSATTRAPSERNGGVSTAERQRPNTPWSRGAPPAGPPNKISAPAADSGGTRPPHNAAPPAAKRKSKRDEREPVSVDATQREGDQPESSRTASSASHFLAQALTARHELQVVGFDTPGIAPDTLREIAVALDDVLTEHPYLTPDEFVIADCGEKVTRLEWDRIPGEHGLRTRISRLTLHDVVARRPEVYAETVRADTAAGRLAGGSEKRPVYCAIVRELGRALDILGDRRARPVAQRTLIAEYFSVRGEARFEETLGSVVRGYTQWRAGSTGCGLRDGRFDPASALADAFVEVQLHRKEAGAPARALRQLLVDTVRP